MEKNTDKYDWEIRARALKEAAQIKWPKSTIDPTKEVRKDRDLR